MTRGKYARTPEIRLKMSNAKKGNKYCLGRRLSKKTKEKISRSLQGNKLSDSTKRKIAKTHKENKSYNWKGEYAGYTAKHIWINKYYGSPKLCDHCRSKSAKRYEWANVSKLYKRQRADWLRLCKSCHIKYDRDESNIAA